MANTQSAIKRSKQNNKINLHNKSLKSKMRTAIKSLRLSITNKDQQLIEKKLSMTLRIIDKSSAKGLIKKGTANRYKSHLNAASKKILQSAQTPN